MENYRYLVRHINGSKIGCVILPVFLIIFFLGYSPDAFSSPEVNDPLFGEQKSLFDKLSVLEAWRVTKGSPDVLIGIIDLGFDFFHPDLKLAPGFYAQEGYHPEIYEVVAHGTWVASIIGAKINEVGMVGLAPECEILTASYGLIEHKPLKMQKEFVKNNPEATFLELQEEMLKHTEEIEKWGREWTNYMALSISEAIRYLADQGVKVINISAFLSRGSFFNVEAWEELEKAFFYAEENDVIMVLGAGNNAIKCEDYPGGSLTIIAGATLLNDERWEEEVDYIGTKIKQGSNYGEKLTMMAPVQDIVVCEPHEKRFYSWESGPMGPGNVEFKDIYNTLQIGATSSAAPVVTSLIGLVYSVRPDLDAKSVVEIVKKGCDDIGEEGYDMYTGYGRVNFAKTIDLAKNWPAGN